MECGAWALRNRSAHVSAASIFDNASGTLRTADNCPVISLHSVYPVLRQFYATAELSFDGVPWTTWANERWEDGSILTICVFYLAATFAAQALLHTLKMKFGLRTSLTVWNAALAMFSTMGAVRMIPHLAHLLSTRGLYRSVCAPAEPAYGSGAAGLWLLLFVLSKVPELFDTAFIVLRGKPLIFLHWYHHATVLLYTWQSYATRAAPGIWFCAMNYTVHAVMYTYYALQAAGYKPGWGAIVTTMQISQMFVGIAIVAASTLYTAHGLPCDVDRSNAQAAAAMYASYAALFVWFALGKYCRRGATSMKEE